MRRKNQKIDTVGIDLGTTNSLVTYVRDGRPQVIVNERGARLTPSVVSFRDDDSVLVGELAKNQIVADHENTVAYVKTEMGTDTRYRVREREFTPIECSAFILRKLKNYTEECLGYPVENAIITVPAYFDDRQRQATLKAGTLAGFNVTKLLNEPTAAALAYGLSSAGNENMLVFDLGGGTLDITLMEYRNNVFRVIGVGGSTSIGGNNFDQQLAKHLVASFETASGVSLQDDPVALQQVLIHAERAKRDLSTVETVDLFVPFLGANEDGPVHLSSELTRYEFEEMISGYLSHIREILLSTFAEAGKDLSWVSSVLFAGGATRIPAIRDLVTTAVRGEHSGKDIQIFEESNPDEVVAMGAGTLAGILSGVIAEVTFYDITSHDLGIEDDEGNFVKLIAKGTSYPCAETKLFTTTADDQSEVTVRVLQNGVQDGESPWVSLGEFTLSEIDPAPAGTPNIDVTFRIDEHGIMNITAFDLDTGKHEEIALSGNEWLRDKADRDRRGSGLRIV